jgi:hypothetical protein
MFNIEQDVDSNKSIALSRCLFMSSRETKDDAADQRRISVTKKQHRVEQFVQLTQTTSINDETMFEQSAYA